MNTTNLVAESYHFRLSHDTTTGLILPRKLCALLRIFYLGGCSIRRRRNTLIETVLGLINAACLIGASLVPFYLVFKTTVRTLRILSLLLGLFALSHGTYHLLFTLVVGYPARAFLDSFSVVVLISFGIYYAKRGGFA